jgi:hypothetical protein
MDCFPPGPYPDGTPETWAKEVLDQGVRGNGSISNLSDGDFIFHSARWQTIHGPSTVVRTDDGAFMVWGAQLADGRRVHCRRSTNSGLWRRRSDDGRSWIVGQIRFLHDEVFFSDGVAYRPSVVLNENSFEDAMANQPEFISALQNDSFAFTLNRELWVEYLCTMDASVHWAPSRGEAGNTIARLRGFGEYYLDFENGGPYPEPPRTDRSVLLTTLAAAGWRYQNDDEIRRFYPELIR